MTSEVVSAIRRDLRAVAVPEKAAFLPRFFKTGKGEYGEGDIFIGVTVPLIRMIALRYAKEVSFTDIRKLISSPVHEERYVAFEMIVSLYEGGDAKIKKQVFDFYMRCKAWANNWDLVDTSAPYIVGEYVVEHTKSFHVLKKLAHSKKLWDRRIAIVSTFAFIKKGSDTECHQVADVLLLDREDLIHKAVGWMLREAGKRVSKQSLEEFLRPRYTKMPRTMLRYAIEHFSKKERQQYLLK